MEKPTSHRRSSVAFGVLLLVALEVFAEPPLAEDTARSAVEQQVDGYLGALAERRCQDFISYWSGTDLLSKERKREEIKFCRMATRRTKILGWTIKSVAFDGDSADVAVELEIKTRVGWFRHATCREGQALRLQQEGGVWLIAPSATRGTKVVENSCDG